MYQLVSALVKPLDSRGRWRTMDVGPVALNLLYNDFRRVIVILSNTVLDHQVSLDLEQLRPQLGGLRQTFNAWLTANGNTTLPTSNTIPSINTRFAEFTDAIRADWHATPIHPTISASSSLPLSQRTNLLLTKDKADYAVAYKNVLVNVNGFYHQTDYSSDGLFVVDGMKSCFKSKRNEVGLLSFQSLGELSFIPITEDMIYVLNPDSKLRTNCYINTGQDLSNKTVMLVLGGYLHLVDQSMFFRVSSTAFGVNFDRIPLIDRYYESAKVLDLSALGMESTDANPSQISINNLYSDEVLKKYLQLPQTFFVVLDNTDIFSDTIEVRQSPFPGIYTAHTPPIYPLTLGHGKHEVFWPRKEYDRYSISISGSWEGNHNYDSVRTRELNSVSDVNVISQGFRNSEAHFQLIGSDIYMG